MKLLDLVICGLPGFPTETRVPLDELGDASVVCVTGPNGSGKTTVIEAPVAAWSRKFPSRGMLAEGCTEPKSYVRAVYDVGGKRVEIEVNISGTTGKIVSRKFDVDPTVPFAERSIKSLADFTAAVAEHLPSREVYLSSAFGTSNKAGSFLTLGFAERRRLLAQIIGIEKWQERSDAAKDRAKALTSDLAVLKGKIAALESSGTVDDEEIVRANAGVEDALETVDEAEDKYEAQRKLVEEWTASVAEIDAKITAATTEKTHAEKEAAGIAERLEVLRTEHAELEERLAGRDALEALAKQACDDPETLDAEIRKMLGEEKEYERLIAEWKRLKDDRTTRIMRRETELATSKQKAALLEEVPCGDSFLECKLLGDAIAYRDAIPHNEKDIVEAKAVPIPEEPVRPDRERRIQTEALLPIVRKKAKGIADAKTAAAGMEAAGVRFDKVADGIMVEEKKNVAAVDAAATIRETISALCDDRTAKADSKPTPADKDAVDNARTALQAKRDELARLEERKRLADEAAVTLKDTREKIAAKTIDLDDWATLRDACGPTGIQAYLIDAAAPELSAICNDVLHECYGSRFTVRLATQAAAAKKGVTNEVCDITVLDNERGTDCSASVKSTGEQALINEALSLAGVVYNNRNADIPMRDIFRDECTTGLDMENGPLYIGMLRKAAKMCEARIFPVLHLPSLFDLCDGRLHVEGGKVEVR